MLDQETKRKINNARDILVGKVPDPKSQVEQITIALIYKFMYDMDEEAFGLGGKRSFFAKKFAKYGWDKLMDKSLSGESRLRLYVEAIDEMGGASHIPRLFRDILKGAFLPYKEPQTLNLFLKEIGGFTYDHSERLGDAFEYLLSVLGAQGDAGQFRTPRHVIDFIVAIIDPKKDETVLDPACGTAGFLISSYKHILKANANAEGHSVLTPDEKKELAANFRGYDISPDMVRLSLVNMYLHGFVDPHIAEYDTLTSEERWNEYADVILANPPFMSPKGGIRPHNRFSVQSRRSEVLFVDYIAEHLTPAGRAGVIVPEGIIFQSQRAHKQLRKMLVEDYLVAVVSLPAGVFQPYSGVKTSILLLDRSLAKKTDRIAFFKVENDGFDLGAQRREIAENDLPQVKKELGEYLKWLRSGEAVDDFAPTLGLVVGKERVAEGGEYNLSGERYRESSKRTSKFPYVSVDKVAKIVAGNSAPQGAGYFEDGKFPFIRTSDVGGVHRSDNFFGTVDKVNQKAVDELRLRLFPPGTILFPKSGASTFLNHRVLIREAAYVSSHLACIICDEQKVLPQYVYHLLCQTDARTITPDQAYPSLRLKEIGNIEIPLPPLEVQREIVAEIEGYRRVIEGARTVVENWRPQIAIDPEWPMVAIGKTCIVNPRKSELAGLDESTTVSFVPMADMDEGTMYFAPKDCKCLKEVGSSYTYFKDDDVLIAKVTPCFENGKAGIAKGLSNGIGFGSSEFYVLRPSEAALPEWIFLCVATPAFRAWATPRMTGTGGLQRVPRSVIENYKIPLPSLTIQQAIVTEIEVEQSLVVANRELMERMEEKIRTAIGQVWNG